MKDIVASSRCLQAPVGRRAAWSLSSENHAAMPLTARLPQRRTVAPASPILLRALIRASVASVARQENAEPRPAMFVVHFHDTRGIHSSAVEIELFRTSRAREACYGWTNASQRTIQEPLKHLSRMSRLTRRVCIVRALIRPPKTADVAVPSVGSPALWTSL